MFPFFMLPGSGFGPKLTGDEPAWFIGFYLGMLLAMIWIMLSAVIFMAAFGDPCFELSYCWSGQCSPVPPWTWLCQGYRLESLWLGIPAAIVTVSIAIAVRIDRRIGRP